MEAEQQGIRFAGEVKIRKAMITTPSGQTQNIIGQVAGIDIFEDIFSPFITGHIIIKDSLDLVNLLALNGQDILDLEIETPSLESDTAIRAKYILYKMSDKEVLGDKNVVYTLHFMSIEALVSLNKKVSRSYKGNIGETVQDILTDEIDGLETSKQVYIETTANTHQHVSNWWTPLQNIQYLVQRAVNENEAPYTFFENRDGFFFISLESMYDARTYQEFVHDKYTRDEYGDGSKDVKNISEDYKRIIDMKIDVAYDFIKRIKTGMFGSRQITYDLFTKKYTVKDFVTADEFENLINLNQNIGIARNGVARPIAAQMVHIKTSNTFTEYTDNDGDTSNYTTIQKREALMNMAKLNCITITVPGRVDYSAGQKVNITVPKMNPLAKDDEDPNDNRWSGNYIVAAVNHSITRRRHECTMELISDTLQMSVNGDAEDN